MKILAVSPSYAPVVGGAERLLQQVAERLVRRGHSVTVVTLNCATHRDFRSDLGAGLPADEILNGVRVVRIRPGPLWFEKFLRFARAKRGGYGLTKLFLGNAMEFPLANPSGARTLIPLLKQDADVISSVNWGYGTSFWASFVARVRRIPHVAVPILHVHQEWSERPIYARMLRRVNGSLVLTSAEGDFIRKRGARSVAVCGCGVDVERYRVADGSLIRQRLGIEGDTPVVGFVGRQEPKKGLTTLIDAMKIVWQTVPDATLLIAGPRAHRHQEVTERLDSLTARESDRVVFLDDFPNEDGPAIMAAVDLLALPSVEEGFGMVTIEAWACGKAVIGADIASTRCLIDHGIDGWLVKPFDAEDLSSRILTLVTDRDQRESFGARGRDKVNARYTWEQVTDVWEAAYLTAMKEAYHHTSR